MARMSHRMAIVCGLLAGLVAAGAAAQAQQVYRYVDKDGRVVYSDRVPPDSAKDVQAKRLSGNFIENNELPIASRQAAERYPVTLYTFACGELCQNAEGLLNRRGVPFATVNVEDPKGAEQLQRLTGEMQAPVLAVGDKLIAKGYNEARWQTMLDEAGYPKTPASRRQQTPRAPDGGGAPPPAAEPPPTSAAPTVGGGYPKQ